MNEVEIFRITYPMFSCLIKSNLQFFGYNDIKTWSWKESKKEHFIFLTVVSTQNIFLSNWQLFIHNHIKNRFQHKKYDSISTAWITIKSACVLAYQPARECYKWNILNYVPFLVSCFWYRVPFRVKVQWCSIYGTIRRVGSQSGRQADLSFRKSLLCYNKSHTFRCYQS